MATKEAARTKEDQAAVQAQLAETIKAAQALHKKLTGHLSQAELKELSRLLEKLREPWAEHDE